MICIICHRAIARTRILGKLNGGMEFIPSENRINMEFGCNVNRINSEGETRRELKLRELKFIPIGGIQSRKFLRK